MCSQQEKIQEKIVESLKRNGLTVSFTESITGGMLAAGITSVPGASAVLKGSLVTYSNETKESLAGVSADTINMYSAVSRETALEMAKGGRAAVGSDICLSITGNAGPDASEGQPVGMVYMAVNSAYRNEYRKFMFSGDRGEIRNKALQEAYRFLEEVLREDYSWKE